MLKQFKSLPSPITRKVLYDFGHYLAHDKDETFYAGKEEGEELLVIASYISQDDDPFLIVFDEKAEESYSLFAGFIENAPDFYDHPQQLDFGFDDDEDDDDE